MGGDDPMIRDVFDPRSPDCRHCQLPVALRAALVPPYLIYLTGATIEHVANRRNRRRSRSAR